MSLPGLRSEETEQHQQPRAALGQGVPSAQHPPTNN